MQNKTLAALVSGAALVLFGAGCQMQPVSTDTQTDVNQGYSLDGTSDTEVNYDNEMGGDTEEAERKYITIEPSTEYATTFTVYDDGEEVDTITFSREHIQDYVSKSQNYLYAGYTPEGLGGAIIFGGPQTVYRVNAYTAEVEELYSNEKNETVDFSPLFFADHSDNDMYIAVVGLNAADGAQMVQVTNLESGDEQTYLDNIERPVLGNVEFSPDNTMMAFVSHTTADAETTQSAVVKVNLETQEQEVIEEFEGETVKVLGWNSDGTVQYQVAQ